MSFNSRKQFQQRISTLGDQTKDLNADVNSLAQALQLHHDLMRKEKSSARGILKKEIGGSIWQYGGEGKLRDYRSSKYSEDAAKPPPKSACSSSKRSSSKSAQLYSKTRTVASASKEKAPKDKRQNVEKSASTISPSVRKAENKGQNRFSVKQVFAKNEVSHKKHHLLGYDSSVEEAKDIASKFSHLHIGLNETYTKDACGESLFSLPVAPEKDSTGQRDCSENSPDKRSRVLKKMIKKLDVDLKLGEYKTSETDSDSPSTSQQANSEPLTAGRPAQYCDPDVLAWLMNQGLKNTEKYARIFAEYKVNMAGLVLLDERRLRQMGITASGTLFKLSNAIEHLKRPLTGSSSKQPLDAASSQLKDTKDGKMPEKYVRQQHKTNISGVTERKICNHSDKSSRKTNEMECHPSLVIKQNHVSQSLSTKNSVKSNSATRKASLQRRPQSAVLNTNKLPNKHRSKNRPNSACLTKAEKNVDMKLYHEAGSPEENRECVLNKEAALSSLIAIRPLAVHSSHALELKEADKENDITNGDTFSNETESRLQLIEQQIHELQKELTSPAALDIISSLQTQLQQIQNEVLIKNKCSVENNPHQSIDGEQNPAADTQVSSVKHSKQYSNDSQELRPSSNDFDPGVSRVKHKDSETMGALSKSKVINPRALSMSLSKAELLKEVRKQNDAHRKHIRHLESELSRLKYKDPIRNCEIPEKEIHFSQQDLLGEGAFSQVFRGSYQGSEVAVKRLKVPLSSQDKNYFTAEVNLLRELRHPRVVLLLGVCTTSQHPLMILEYMAQGSLYSYLHNPDSVQLDHAGYYQIAKDMALGMNYLHRHTPVVMHLDLKSMNVLLSVHLRAKIADFGFSKLRYDANQSMAKSSKVHTTGTPAWMAPELLNTGDISLKSDVYSYSIILWEMLTRKHPYEGCSMFQVIERTRTNKRLGIPSYCPFGLRDLISSCWSQNPAKRPSFKDILATLEKLQFPGEWRKLFAEAGIPETVLNNAESSRTLIDIVTVTLEDIPRHPDDIPVLNLEDSDEEIRERILSVSDDEWEDVTGDDEDSEIETNHHNVYRPFDVPRLNLNLSGDLNEVRKQTAISSKMVDQKQHKSSKQGKMNSAKQEMNSTDAYSSAPLGATPHQISQSPAQPNIPPPPPPPPFDQFPHTLMQAPDLLTHTTTKQKHNVHDSFMEQLELALRDPLPLTKLNRVPHDCQKSAHSHKLSGFSLRASQLMSQKKQLRSTDKPHPCQLTDLALVSEEKRKNLFVVLKKAVENRRFQMNDGKSLEQSLSADWSLDD